MQKCSKFLAFFKKQLKVDKKKLQMSINMGHYTTNVHQCFLLSRMVSLALKMVRSIFVVILFTSGFAFKLGNFSIGSIPFGTIPPSLISEKMNFKQFAFVNKATNVTQFYQEFKFGNRSNCKCTNIQRNDTILRFIKTIISNRRWVFGWKHWNQSMVRFQLYKGKY